MKRILYFLLLLLAGCSLKPLYAQQEPEHLFRIYVDNDFINFRGKGTDQFYTNGCDSTSSIPVVKNHVCCPQQATAASMWLDGVSCKPPSHQVISKPPITSQTIMLIQALCLPPIPCGPIMQKSGIACKQNCYWA